MKKLIMLMVSVFTILSVSVWAQDSSKAKMKTSKQKSERVKYSCPMHPDVTSDKPGKCTKCGMDLALSPKEKMKMEVVKKYCCPVHPEETSDKPGKCPKCGTVMNRSPKEKM